MCGNFGFLGKRKESDNNDLLPKRVIDIYQKMGEETEVRGEQAGGGLTLSATEKGNLIFVSQKIVNRKRKNLTKSLEMSFKVARKQAIKEGQKPLNTNIMGVWHYRYATSSPPSLLETHYHQWLPARLKQVWQVENGQWVKRSKIINHCITHNGDFDGWIFKDQLIDNAQLGLWLEAVLHTSNNTLGDSPKIAGIIDLLLTQGMWEESARLAYQLILVSSIEDNFDQKEPSKITLKLNNTAPSEKILQQWAEIFSRKFHKYTNSLSTGNTEFSKHLKIALADDIFFIFRQNIYFIEYNNAQLYSFIELTIQSFFENDLYQATKLFMSKAFGSFGLVVVTTLEEDKIALCSLIQPMSIGFNPDQDYVIYASEATAVDKVLFDQPNSKRLALNSKDGEIALLSINDLRIFSMVTKLELNSEEIQARLISSEDHPYIKFNTTNSKDPVYNDLQEIPQILRKINASWSNHQTSNRVTASYLLEKLVSKITSQNNDTQSGKTNSLDFLITGIENSLWIGERFAEDLECIFPELKISCISSNELLEKLQNDYNSLKLDKQSIVLLITQSGQTYPTIETLNRFLYLVEQKTINDVFVLTGEPANFIGSALLETQIFINECGRRTAEPCTITSASMHQTLTELLLYLAKGMRLTFPSSSPLGMTIQSQDILLLEKIKYDFFNQNVCTIIGYNTSGIKIQSIFNQNLIKNGKKWSLNITENPTAWIIHSLYILISIGWSIPFGYSIPLARTISIGLLTIFSISTQSFLMNFFNPLITIIDIIIYIFGFWFWIMGLRYFQGREILARTGTRTLIIGDISWINCLLESYVSKLFSLSYGIASLDIHAANPQDNLLHHFGHRVKRGVLVFLGLPDGRVSELANKESSALMTAKQTYAIKHLGIGANIILLGHNPKIAKIKFFKNLIVPSKSNYLIKNKSLEITDQKTFAKLVESRFSSFERLLASYIFFWAFAKEVSSFPFLRYQHWKSQSRTKIMTTSSPVSAIDYIWGSRA